MDNLVIITAYCPTEEQEKKLEKCVDSILSSDYHVALISHTHVPIHIQKKCNYYFYDYFNDVSDDYNFLEHENYNFGDKIIQSRFFQKYFYGFAIYRMFAIASQIAINFGYKNIHHIEYDCELIDKDLISEHNKLLETYDSIIYTDNGKEDGFLFGSFKSFKVESLPDKIKNYDKNFISEKMMESQPKNLEVVTKNILLKSNKVLIKHENEIRPNRFIKESSFYSRNLHYTLYYDDSNKNLHIFYKAFKEQDEKICVVVNNNHVVTFDVKPNTWSIRPLGIFDNITHVRIDNSDKVIYQKSFDYEFREIFKIKSYISPYEKNN